MSRKGASYAFQEMLAAIEDDNVQLASYWAMIFLAEDRAAEQGTFFRRRREAAISRNDSEPS